VTAKILETPAEAAPRAGARAGLVLRPLVMAIAPILATLAVSGGLLLAFGVDPLERRTLSLNQEDCKGDVIPFPREVIRDAEAVFA
jgi:hypothetical protein